MVLIGVDCGRENEGWSFKGREDGDDDDEKDGNNDNDKDEKDNNNDDKDENDNNDDKNKFDNNDDDDDGRECKREIGKRRDERDKYMTNGFRKGKKKKKKNRMQKDKKRY